ncbi:MAG: cell division protein FtsJ [Paenibacillus sp.]|nr:cell division protein FtsJ [Paenibacillus sp.]
METHNKRPSIYLYLDDMRPCPAGFVLARTAEECKLFLNECDVQILSLDYELGWNSPTGMDVAKHIAMNLEADRYPREIYMHSSSPSGRASMFQLLYAHKPEHVQLYNSPVPDDILLRIEQTKL